MIPIEQQIIDLIKAKAEDHYSEYTEMRLAFGSDDRGARHSAAQWNAVLTILEKVEELVEQQNNKKNEAK
jgi:hypothetical protein